jgi:HD superfamily phosphohydrolase YqeK
MQVMSELAEIYALDRTQALVAGLLHDAAKDLSAAESFFERW